MPGLAVVRAIVVRSSWAVVRAMVHASYAPTGRLAALVFAALWWCGAPGPQSAHLTRSGRLATLVFAALWWCGAPGPQSAQSSAQPTRTGRLATLVVAAREDRTTFQDRTT